MAYTILGQDDENLRIEVVEGEVTTINIQPASFTITGSGAPVLSVNGYTGAVQLNTDDIPEGINNLYYTDARAQAVIDLNTAGYATTADVISGDLTTLTSANAFTTTAIATFQTTYVDPELSSTLAAANAYTDSQVFSGDYNDLINQPFIPTDTGDLTNGAGYITDYTVTETDVTQHQAALQITESQITDLVHYNDTDTDNFLRSGSADLIALNDTVTGNLSWNAVAQTLDITMGGGVVQQVGEEVYYPKLTFNNTGVTIPNGTPVMAVGPVTGTLTYIAPAIADASIPAHLYLGVTTEDIPDQQTGRVTYFGSIRDIDTSLYTKGTLLYVSPTTPGGVTTAAPATPNLVLPVGVVTYQHPTEGRVFVRHETVPNSIEINYDNTTSGLLASNVKTAIDELQQTKADISLLNSNITLYPTNVVGDFGYYRMVTSTDDPFYNTVAVDVSTGPINTNDQLVGQLIAEPGLFIGNPGILNVPTIGNIAKVAGNSTQYAAFYFTIYLRDAGGVETLVATSSSTGAINPGDTAYREFQATALLNNGSWGATDRVVIKYWAELLGNVGSAYTFQFGGTSPVRTQLPVPVSVIPSADASGILVDTSNFTGNLSAADSNVQLALETLDGYTYAEIDPIFVASPAYNITAPQISNWDTAYGWGDHSTAGYLSSVALNDVSDVILTLPTVDQVLAFDGVNWVNADAPSGYTDAQAVAAVGAESPLNLTSVDVAGGAIFNGGFTSNQNSTVNGHLTLQDGKQLRTSSIRTPYGQLNLIGQFGDDFLSLNDNEWSTANFNGKIILQTSGNNVDPGDPYGFFMQTLGNDKGMYFNSHGDMIFDGQTGGSDPTHGVTFWGHGRLGMTIDRDIMYTGKPFQVYNVHVDITAPALPDEGSHWLDTTNPAAAELKTYRSGLGGWIPVWDQKEGLMIYDYLNNKVLIRSGGAWIELAGGGGGATALNDLTDVVINQGLLGDGDILRYNGTAMEWQNTNIGISLAPTLELQNIDGEYTADQMACIRVSGVYDQPSYEAILVNPDLSETPLSITTVRPALNPQTLRSTMAGKCFIAQNNANFMIPNVPGTYTFKIRVQDFGDLPSEWATIQFTAIAIDFNPGNNSGRYVRWTSLREAYTIGTTDPFMGDVLLLANQYPQLNDLAYYTAPAGGGSKHPSAFMTSNTAPAPYVATASTVFINSASYQPWKAFDSSTSTQWWGYNATLGGNDWIQLDMGSSQIIKSMGSYTSSLSYWSPGFKIEVSETGEFAGEQTKIFQVDGWTPGPSYAVTIIG